MSKFLHHHDADDARAMTIPRRFFENSLAKNGNKVTLNCPVTLLILRTFDKSN